MIEWAKESPYLATIIIYCALEVTFRIINRTLRTVKVCARGWPANPIMDADGDICHPEVKK